MRFLWGLIAAEALLAWPGMTWAVLHADSAVQQAAIAACACAGVVIPYVLARAIEGFSAAGERLASQRQDEHG